MTPTVAAFLSTVREHPKFIAAARERPIFAEHFDAMETGLRALYADGGDNVKALETLDRITATVSRGDLSLKQRLVALAEILTDHRDKTQ